MPKIAKIVACGELNLLNFEQVNPVSPKMYNSNLKKRPLLLELGKQSCTVNLIFFKDLISSIQNFIKAKFLFSLGRPSPRMIEY